MKSPVGLALRRLGVFEDADMPVLTEVVVHRARTATSDYQYQFTPKHHGADPKASQWLPSMSLEDEFGVFNLAYEHDLSDDSGRLYGVWPDDDGGLRYLGTWNQQVAEFPRPSGDEPWHGYPVYPLKDLGPPNRRGEKCRPAPAVFTKMVQSGMIVGSQRRRLLKGDHV